MGQLQATTENPSKIFLVTPKYIFDYSAGPHLTNYSYRKLGEYYGKVMKKVLVDNQIWKPLTIESVIIYDNIIKAKFYVPQPPLQFDTENVMLTNNYGFEYFDDANSASIVNVTITDPTTVTITLNQTPTGKNMELAYAYTGKPGAKPGRNSTDSPKGNLCDSDTTPTFYDYSTSKLGNTLNNWCMTFIEPIKKSNEPFLEVIKYDKKDSFSLYLNKNSDELDINIPECIPEMKYVIYNSNRQEIINNQITCTTTKVDLSNVSSGLYFIKIINVDSSEVKKFLKI